MPSRPKTQKPTLPHAALLLDRQLCFALYSASLAMTKLYKPLLAPLGLTYPQYLALLCLWESDGMTVTHLGERLQLDSGTLTPLLKRMEAAGWLRRERSTEDERRVLVWLTATGHALQQQAQNIPGCVLQASECSLQQVQSLNRQVRQLRDRVIAHTH